MGCSSSRPYTSAGDAKLAEVVVTSPSNEKPPQTTSSSHGTNVVAPSKPSGELTPAAIDAAWRIANDQAAKTKAIPAPVIKRTTWKTIRIFVSSTFKDFDSEREILVKKVFPDLRIWCQSRRLHLVECDLRWGIPLESAAEAPLRACLGEIDHCFAENVLPFFVNMTSERVGWIPQDEQLPDWFRKQYNWVDGFSITEIEIMHAAYKINSPNALFLIRDRGFLDTVPSEYHHHFIDENPIAPYKLSVLKKMVEKRFKPQGHVIHYKCRYGGIDPITKWPRLVGLEETVAQSVFKFFQERISAQYPLIETAKLNPLEECKNQHETFMKLQSEAVVGRDALIQELMEKYVEVGKNLRPVLIGGGPGLGKTSIMCALGQACLTKATSAKLPKPNLAKGWHVFNHFVGALPRSGDLLAMLNRLLVEIKVRGEKTKLLTDLEEAMGMVRGALQKDSTEDCIIVIDAIHQFDDVRGQVAPIAWLPTSLGANVRVFVSAIPESTQYQRIQRDFGDSWDIVYLQPLDRKTKEFFVTSILSRYNKILDPPQMELLFNKRSADNPLWLSSATEELRIFGSVRQLTSKINSLPDSLFELLEAILERFERESDAALLVATLCLLVSSVGGLLESELVELLATPNLIPKELTERLLSRNQVTITNPTNLVSERETDGARRIPASRWADVSRFIRPFLRPFGSSSEGHLDFYHLSLSKVIRKRYFASEIEDDSQPVSEIQRFYSKMLANYFSNSSIADLERRITEYPNAAYHCSDIDGLKAFLSDFDAFDAMYDEEFSSQQSQGWALVHNLDQRTKPADKQSANIYEIMEKIFTDTVEKLCSSNNKGDIKDKLPLPERLERIARVFMQNRCCEAAAKVADRLVKMTDVPENVFNSEKLLYHASHIYLKAIIVDEDLRIHDYFLRIHAPNYDPKPILPRLVELVDCYQSAIGIFRELVPNDPRLGRCLNGVAFHYLGISMRGGFADLTAESAKRLAISHIEDGLALYLRLKDQSLSVADCLITRGICELEPTPVQLSYFEKGQDLIIEKFGPFHPLLLRAYFNIGIYSQELGDGDGAYTYFHKWYQLLSDVYGAHHPRTIRAGNFLNEGSFRQIAAQRGHVIMTKNAPIIAGKRTSDVDGLDQAIGVGEITFD